MSNLYLSPKKSASGVAFPATFALLVAAIAEHIGIGGLLSTTGINKGSGTPAANDQDKPWFRLDGDGNPVGWYWYNSTRWDPVEPIGKCIPLDKAVSTVPYGWKVCNGIGQYKDHLGVDKDVPCQ